MIKDKFGRIHTYLRISLTEKCNLRCKYCMPAEGVQLTPKPHLMTADEVVSIAKVFVQNGITKIRLTGGEPLLRKDAAQIIHQLSQLPIELSLTTNGILVHKFIDVFKTAGMRTINLSLDTLKPNKFKGITLFDKFEQVWQNIQLLMENDIKVKLNIVAMKGFNDDEIIDFIELTKEYPIDVRFIEFMPFDSNNWSESKTLTQREILGQIEDHYSSNRIEKLKDQKHFIAREYRLSGYKGTFGVISTVSNPFCEGCNRIRLTADGKIKNCLFSNQETNLLEHLRNGEELLPHIQTNISKKHKTRAGMDTNDKFADPAYNQENRSMIVIGG